MFNRNLIVLSISQIFSFTAAPITVFLSGIIGSSMTDVKSLVTLPTALMIVGTSLGSIIASYLMSKTSRKFGFMFSTIITSLAAFIISSKYWNHFYRYIICDYILSNVNK